MLRKKLEITGLVQGIGFRPAIYRLAGICNLTGFVINNERGVVIEVQGAESDVISFLEKIQKPEELPGLARIDQLTTNEITPKRVEDGFEILSSRKSGEVRAQVSPDLAVCSRCLDELLNTADFRHGYPFIN